MPNLTTQKRSRSIDRSNGEFCNFLSGQLSSWNSQPLTCHPMRLSPSLDCKPHNPCHTLLWVQSNNNNNMMSRTNSHSSCEYHNFYLVNYLCGNGPSWPDIFFHLPFYMNYKHIAPCCTIPRLQFCNQNIEHDKWLFKWWVMWFSMWLTISCDTAIPDLPSSATPTLHELQTPCHTMEMFCDEIVWLLIVMEVF